MFTLNYLKLMFSQIQQLIIHRKVVSICITSNSINVQIKENYRF